MNCNKQQTIKVAEGNAFTLVFPLKRRTYVSDKPIDEDIIIDDLTDVVVTFGGVEYQSTKDPRGLMISLPATLTRKVYDAIIRATYHGAQIQASYFEAVSIVEWNFQSTAEQYIPGSPIILNAAYIIGGPMTDAELEALKEEWREKNAQLDQAIADAEAAKREWEEKAADLDGVAKEQTLTQGVADIRDDISHINIDTTTLAKQGTNPDATLSEVQAKIGSPASGQGADLFAAMRDIALSATTLQELADAWSAMVTHRESLDGLTFLPSDVIDGVFKILFYGHTHLVEVDDNTITELVTPSYAGEPTMPSGLFYFNSQWTNIKKVTLRNLTRIVGRTIFHLAPALEEIYLPSLVSFNSYSNIFDGPAIKKVYLPQCAGVSSGASIFAGANLIDITLGAVPTSFAMAGWSPTNALDANSQTLLTAEDIAAGFTSNLEKLLYNIREHIAANLPVAPNTITFSAAVKAAILADQPTADAFTNKGWTIA